MSTYRIWLDDEREMPIIDRVVSKHCHSVNRAKKSLIKAEKMGFTEFILDLDHDLGDKYRHAGGDGIAFLDWLIETGRTTARYKVILHTMNVVGREQMSLAIERYWNK